MYINEPVILSWLNISRNFYKNDGENLSGSWAGAALIVGRDNEVLFRSTSGMSDMEPDVPLAPNMFT